MSAVGEEAAKEKPPTTLEEHVNCYRRKKDLYDTLEWYCRESADRNAFLTELIQDYGCAPCDAFSGGLADLQICLAESLECHNSAEKRKAEALESFVANVVAAEHHVLQLAPHGDAARRLTSTADIEEKMHVIDSFFDSRVEDKAVFTDGPAAEGADAARCSSSSSGKSVNQLISRFQAHNLCNS